MTELVNSSSHMKLAVLWLLAPCSLVEFHWCYRGQTESTSETSVNFYHTIGTNNLWDSHLHNRDHENLKYQSFSFIHLRTFAHETEWLNYLKFYQFTIFWTHSRVWRRLSFGYRAVYSGKIYRRFGGACSLLSYYTVQQPARCHLLTRRRDSLKSLFKSSSMRRLFLILGVPLTCIADCTFSRNMFLALIQSPFRWLFLYRPPTLIILMLSPKHMRNCSGRKTLRQQYKLTGWCSIRKHCCHLLLRAVYSCFTREVIYTRWATNAWGVVSPGAIERAPVRYVQRTAHLRPIVALLWCAV
jgi:hypothetical protein